MADTQETALPTSTPIVPAGGGEEEGEGTVVGVAQEVVDPPEQKGAGHTAIELHVDESDSPKAGLLSSETST